MEEILKEKIHQTLKERNDFWDRKSKLIRLSLQSTKKKLNEENTKIIEEINDIDREIKSLEAVIKNSSELALSLTKPVKDRERCIENMQNSKVILEYENKLKTLLAKIKSEKNDIEKKISILLEANECIKFNSNVFENYRELILIESQDVINYLMKIYNEKINEITNSLKNPIVIKEFNANLVSLDKTCLLIYKLNVDKKFMEKYFDTIIEFIVKLISKNKIEEYTEQLANKTKKDILSLDNLKSMVNTINQIISKVFLKLASIINKRKTIYLKEFNDLTLVYILVTILFCNLEKHLEKFFSLLYQIIDQFNIFDPEGNELDFICAEISTIINSFEKFKFFITILQEKIYSLNTEIPSVNHDDMNNYKNKIISFFKKFNGYLYDLGEKYANYEIKLIKIKLLKIFKEHSKNLNSFIESNLKNSYDELAFNIYIPIDDFFYILKVSGNRAIETLNLQLCMAIINNIKSILFDELLEIFDFQISTVLVKSEFKNKNFSELKYICKDEPNLSNKFSSANLFLIICFNLIDQSRSNLFLLFEEFKNYLSETIFHSEIFNHNNLILFGNEFENSLNEQIKYFHKSEIDLINHLFGEVEQLGNRYEEFLGKKIKLLFEFIHPQLKASCEVLNSSNYIVDSKKMNAVDFVESFANKFIEETEKLTNQWKSQSSENSFNKFLAIYCDHVAQFIEMILILKKYNTFGAIILEKDVNKLINYFQEKATISIRDKFNRLIAFVKILNFDTKEELLNHLKMYDDIKLSKMEIENVRKLKKID